MPPTKTRGIKRRKPRTGTGNYLQMPQSMNIPSPAPKTDIVATLSQSSAVPVTNVGRLDPKVQQAKQFAVAQAQQDGCVGNFRSFSSQFGNYLVPLIPTHADLNS